MNYNYHGPVATLSPYVHYDFAADLGDFMEDLYVDHSYLSGHIFVPNQTAEFEQKVSLSLTI